MKRIFLIGYMGSGKTTLGRAFAKATGLSFIDLDWYIEERSHRTISQLFAEEGEEGFRRLERRILHEVSEFENVVVACGGGTPCFLDNMEFMKTKGTTVFLDASLDALFRRLRVASAGRPLLKGKSDTELREFIISGLESRMVWYSKAELRMDASRLESRSQIADSIKVLSDLLNGEKN